MYENYQDVLDAMHSYGLLVDTIEADRVSDKRVPVDLSICGVDKEKQRSAGWYNLKTFSIEGKSFLVGSFGFWKGTSNNAQAVKLDKQISLTPEQRQAMADQHKAAKKNAERLRKAEIDKAATKAKQAWRAYSKDGECDYLQKKNVKAYGVRFHPNANTMAVPMQDAKGSLFGLQIIRGSDRGKKIEKQYWPAGLAKTGHYHLIGSPRELVLVAEGYATAATIHEATGLPIAVAYDANNITPACKSLKTAYPQATIVICADDDALQTCEHKECAKPTTVETPECDHCGKLHGKKNAGIECAQNAAIATNGIWVKPSFIDQDGQDIRNNQRLSDFNDLASHQGGGLHLVRAQIEEATKNIAVRQKPATTAATLQQGGGERVRPAALSVMQVDDIVERFIYVDDVHGDNCFDSWTKDVVKVKKVQGLLPQFVRWDDIKSHPLWQGRAVYRDQIGFDPTESDSNIVCNRWSGWPTKPNTNASTDDCKNLIALLKHLCDVKQNGETVYKWVERWLAYPIQNPGAKMDTAIIFHGPQGTGKNMFFEAYGKIFGEHFSVITQDTMEDQFNSDWVDRKLFVLADEIVAAIERTHVKNKLKTMITGDRIRVNQKMIAAYPEKNFFNMVFLSNESNPVVLEKRDRRYLTIWTPPAMTGFSKDGAGNETKIDWYKLVRDEIDNGGIEALHNYLLNVQMGDFTANSHPPMTEAKQDLILLNADTPYVFYHEWKTGQLGIPFGPSPSDLIYKVYQKWCIQQGEKWTRTSRQFLSSLKTEGVRSVAENRRRNYRPDSGTTKSKFYMPPLEHMAEAQKVKDLVVNNPSENPHKLDFYTTCYMELHNLVVETY